MRAMVYIVGNHHIHSYHSPKQTSLLSPNQTNNPGSCRLLTGPLPCGSKYNGNTYIGPVPKVRTQELLEGPGICTMCLCGPVGWMATSRSLRPRRCAVSSVSRTGCEPLSEAQVAGPRSWNPVSRHPSATAKFEALGASGFLWLKALGD